VLHGVRLAGRLLDGRDEPVVDGVIEVFDATNRLWGRCGTDLDGRFSFVVSSDVPHLEAYVFARGLLKHQLTRIELSEAQRQDGEVDFDIRLQGERQTVFFAV
jgi:protocatechuate 3,4-dioxygenase, alpha subunit